MIKPIQDLQKKYRRRKMTGVTKNLLAYSYLHVDFKGAVGLHNSCAPCSGK